MQSADLQKGCQEYTIRKDYAGQQAVLRKLRVHMQNNEVGSLFYTIHKNHSKWIKDFCVRPETVKLLEENLGEKRHDLGLDSDTDMTPKA